MGRLEKDEKYLVQLFLSEDLFRSLESVAIGSGEKIWDVCMERLRRSFEGQETAVLVREGEIPGPVLEELQVLKAALREMRDRCKDLEREIHDFDVEARKKRVNSLPKPPGDVGR